MDRLAEVGRASQGVGVPYGQDDSIGNEGLEGDGHGVRQSLGDLII